jgi:hypothetical protein
MLLCIFFPRVPNVWNGNWQIFSSYLTRKFRECVFLIVQINYHFFAKSSLRNWVINNKLMITWRQYTCISIHTRWLLFSLLLFHFSQIFWIIDPSNIYQLIFGTFIRQIFIPPIQFLQKIWIRSNIDCLWLIFFNSGFLLLCNISDKFGRLFIFIFIRFFDGLWLLLIIPSDRTIARFWTNNLWWQNSRLSSHSLLLC